MEMTPPMQITLNGSSHRIDRPMTLSELLDSLGLGGKPVVIEMDEQAVFPRNYADTGVKEGSRVEIVTLAAGG
ncbi:MAG: sulfur carrier protein ThiS [Verrucomicrobiaceae bacterium]|nr:MAG: sulfur carrier protein ThiS [Verrucomicrobiaceae bacterium]